MKMIIKNSFFALLASTIIFFGACNKDFDSPPVSVLPEGNVITIDSLRKIYTSQLVPKDSTIDNNLSVYGTITADEIGGNLYKVLYIQDATNGILLKMTASADRTFFIGDKVRVSLRGTKISRYKNMIQLDLVNPAVNLIKQGKGTLITPKVVTIGELALSGIYSPYQGQLVQINDVEFQCSEQCKTWANAITQQDASRYLQDTLGRTLIVRSSGYASFANQVLPMGRGAVIAVVSQYNSDVQLTIRTPSELTLFNSRKSVCPFVNKNFDDQSLTSCGWTTKLVSGPIGSTWGIYAATNSAAKVSNYNSVDTNILSESWLISPSVNLLNSTNPNLSFRNVVNYSLTPKLEVLVSTNYDGISNPNNATWVNLTSLATWDLNATTWSSWTNSGNINLSPYKQSIVYVAFRLVGITSKTTASTWELDDILIKEI